MRMGVGKMGRQEAFVLSAVCAVIALAMCLFANEAYGAEKYTVMICNDPLAKSLSYKPVRNVSADKTLCALNTPTTKPGEVRWGYETNETHMECFADLNKHYYYRCFGNALDSYEAGNVTDQVCVAETETLENVVMKCGIKGTVIYCYLFHKSVSHTLAVSSAPSCKEGGVCSCSVCGKEVLLKPLGHDYQALSQKQPTCGSAGKRMSVCLRCGQKHSEVLPATGKHSFTYKSLGNGGHRAVCKVCHRKEETSACKFAKDGHCKLCGAPRLPANGVITVGKHSYKIVSSSKAVLYRVGANTKKLVIPASVRYAGVKFKIEGVAKGAAKGNAKLVKVCKGANLERIGKGAFRGCRKLKEVKLTSGKLDKLGARSFEGCVKLARFLCKSRISIAQLEKAGVL